MKWMQDIVFYEEKEYQARFLIKKLGLSDITYRNKRREGWGSQKAFEHCLALKRRKNYLKKFNISQLAKVKKVSLQAIYKNIDNENFSDTLLSFDALEEKRNNFQILLSSQDLLSEYNTINEFCIGEGLNACTVYQNLKSGMSLYDAVSKSFSLQFSRNMKNIYLGILVKSLAQKYRLDYDSIQCFFRKTHDYLFAFHQDVFKRVFSNYSVKKKQMLWQVYFNSFLNDISILSSDDVDEEILNLFFKVYWNFQSIQRDFSYYQFLTTFSIPDYTSLSVDERVASFVVRFSTLPFSLEEMYYILDFEQGLMQDFIYYEKKNVWIYKGNREVLKRLKKPSN